MIKALRELWQLLGQQQRWYLLASFLMMLSVLFRSFEPRILQIVVDYVLTLPSEGQASQEVATDRIAKLLLWFLPELTAENLGTLLLGAGLLYLLLSLLRGASVFGGEAIKNWAVDRVAKTQRDQAFAHIQRLPLAYFTTTNRGELIQRITGDVDTIKNFLRGQVFSLIRILVIFVFAFAMMALADWQYALLCICLSPFMVILSYVFFKKERQVWREHEAESDRLNHLVQENLNGIRTVTAYANQAHEIERFSRQNEAKLKMGFRHNLLHTVFWPVSDFLSQMQIVISILAGGYFAVTGRITVGELLSFYTYITMLAFPIRYLGRILSEMGMANVALDRLREIMEADEEHRQGEQPRLRGEIEVRNLTFRYRTQDAPALAGLNFRIQAGEKVAIIGPTGSGKSTLIKLLLRLYAPQEGDLYLDGRSIAEIHPDALRKQIGLALQQPFLFSTTLRENIAYTDPAVALSRVQQATGIAQAHELHRKLPDGFESLLGEKGVTLSGGQKQRVALARTLLPEPGLLVLDDITSAVDTETEQAIFDALEETLAEKTVLIISHRVSSIRQADRVLVLEKGRLVAQGTPDELACQPGYFQDIVAAQTRNERLTER
jgi:ATP-binding cassette, subfamily B, bacterial